MSIFDELRDAIQAGTTWRNSSWKQWKDEVLATIDAVEAAHSPNACDGCRHWRGSAPSAVLGKCCVSGSFRAPGGLFTEGGFWCCHWTKS